VRGLRRRPAEAVQLRQARRRNSSCSHAVGAGGGSCGRRRREGNKVARGLNVKAIIIMKSIVVTRMSAGSGHRRSRSLKAPRSASIAPPRISPSRTEFACHAAPFSCKQWRRARRAGSAALSRRGGRRGRGCRRWEHVGRRGERIQFRGRERVKIHPLECHVHGRKICKPRERAGPTRAAPHGGGRRRAAVRSAFGTVVGACDLHPNRGTDRAAEHGCNVALRPARRAAVSGSRSFEEGGASSSICQATCQPAARGSR
jgi:hypothetical protein